MMLWQILWSTCLQFGWTELALAKWSDRRGEPLETEDWE